LRVGGGELGKGGKNVLGPELERFGRQPGSENVVSKYFGVPGGLFDAEGGGSAAAEAFQAESAGAGEEFEHVSADDSSAKAVEDGLFDQVGRGADAKAFRNFQDAASGSSTSDTHGRKGKGKIRNPKSEIRRPNRKR
jgi:hypothetical protein